MGNSPSSSVSDGSTFSMVMDFEEKPDSSLDLYLLNVNRKTKLANMYLTYPLRRATKCLTIESDEAFTGKDWAVITKLGAHLISDQIMSL